MPTEICRHIRTNGGRCGSPALRGRAFCYFHINLTQRHTGVASGSAADAIPTVLHPLNPAADNSQREPHLAASLPRGPLALDLPPLEDRESIQLALSLLLAAMAQNRIDPKRAGTMLYALQVASANARGLTTEPSRSSIVRETVLDDSGVAIAPDEDSEAEIRYQQFIADVFPGDDDPEDDDEDSEDDDAEEEDDAEEDEDYDEEDEEE